ncbi:MAG: CRISPR-associated endonuclease Cas2 [Gammaproteobacteria bacterium]
MSINKRQLHLVCYDIANPRRLGRVHRFLTSRAVPLQYSVFLANIRPADIPRLITELEEIIDPLEDDVRIYPLPGAPKIERFGNACFPEGVRILENGQDLTTPGEVT